MSGRSVCRAATEFCTGLVERDLALTANVYKLVQLGGNRALVTWAGSHNSEWHPSDSILGSYDEYIGILRASQFSAILNDGAVL